MKKYIFGLFLVGILLSSAQGQNLTNEEAALKWASTIDSNDLKRHLFYLASDYLEGRETATKGNDEAAKYIASFFKKNGLEAIDEDRNYFMDVPFTRFEPDSLTFQLDKSSLDAYKDFVVSPFQQRPLRDFTADKVYFLGYGVEDRAYNDFGSFDWEGKVVLIYKTLPESVKERIVDSSQFELNERLETLNAKGVKAALIVDEQFKSYASRIKRYVMASFLNLGIVNPDSLPLLPNAHLSTAAAEDLIGRKMKKFLAARDELINDGGLKGRPYKIKRDIQLDWVPKLSFTKSQNIMALLPGSNPNLQGEHIIMSAHYDHLGKRGDGIYNGADDNGSGTTTLLEVMETFAEASKAGHGPERSILFMLVTGEEKGLLGSRYYTQNPSLPLSDAVANVNVDMVGRIDKKYKDSSDYIYVIGADRISEDLQDVHILANQRGPKLVLDYTYNEEDDPNRYYYRSDHYNFAKNGIPAIFFFNGTHDDYHRTTDTPDKIAFSSMAERAKLIFLTVWEIANRPQRLSIDHPVE